VRDTSHISERCQGAAGNRTSCFRTSLFVSRKDLRVAPVTMRCLTGAAAANVVRFLSRCQTGVAKASQRARRVERMIDLRGRMPATAARSTVAGPERTH
jgi:hypothetical protein